MTFVERNINIIHYYVFYIINLRVSEFILNTHYATDLSSGGCVRKFTKKNFMTNYILIYFCEEIFIFSIKPHSVVRWSICAEKAQIKGTSKLALYTSFVVLFHYSFVKTSKYGAIALYLLGLKNVIVYRARGECDARLLPKTNSKLPNRRIAVLPNL